MKIKPALLFLPLIALLASCGSEQAAEPVKAIEHVIPSDAEIIRMNGGSRTAPPIPTTSDKPIKVGDTTYANEKELIKAVCAATPGLKGCP